MKSKTLFGLIFVLLTITSQAQNKRKFIPPDMTSKTYSFILPELQVDSIFMKDLNTIMDSIISKRKDSNSWRHFDFRFEKKDSLNYCIVVSLCDVPSRKSIGFFDHSEYFYWFGVDTPLNIILGKKNKKRFSYTEDLIGFIDPPFWYLIYNIQSGSIEEMKENCY